MELESIRNVAAIAKARENGEPDLVVYYIITQVITKEEIAMYINDRLPDYMSPSIFIELESIPQIEKAVYEVVQTHEVLRTSFHAQTEEIAYLSEMKQKLLGGCENQEYSQMLIYNNMEPYWLSKI